MNRRRKNDETHEMGCGRDETDDLKGLKKPRVKEVKGVKGGVWKKSGRSLGSLQLRRAITPPALSVPPRRGEVMCFPSLIYDANPSPRRPDLRSDGRVRLRRRERPGLHLPSADLQQLQESRGGKYTKGPEWCF